MRSKQCCSAASMPRPSRSNLTSPIQAASSLSHWMTVRSFMRACSIGTTSPTGRSVSTMPPEWMPRCRGAFSNSEARVTTASGMSVSTVAGASRAQRAVDLLRPGVLLAGTVPERLGHVAHRVLRPVLDDVRHLRRVAAPVLLEHPLDHLLAPVGVEVDVDVGLLVAQAREEALERQLVDDRVDRGDVEQEADRRVGRRTAALAEDAVAAGEVDDVVHDQEVAGEVLLLDDRELGRDARAVGVVDVGVAFGHSLPHQLAQVRHRRVTRRHLLLRQGGLGAAQREGELCGEFEPCSIAPGYRAKRARISRPERRCAVPARAASRRARRGCAARARPPSPSPDAGGRGWRSARCPSRSPGVRVRRPGRRARRCARCRAGRRGR